MSVHCEVELENSIEEQIEDAKEELEEQLQERIDEAIEDRCDYCEHEHAEASYRLEELQQACQDLPCASGTRAHGRFLGKLVENYSHIEDLANELEDTLNRDPDNLELVQSLACDLRTTIENNECYLTSEFTENQLDDWADELDKVSRLV